MDKKKDYRNSNPLVYLINRQSGNIVNFRQKLIKERLSIAKNLYKDDLVSHFGCVNAIEFSKEGSYLISGGDDRRVLLWDLEKAILGREEPRSMEKQHLSNIFCLSFNSQNTRIFSGGNDDTVIVHDIASGDPVDVFFHTKPVYGLSVDPSNDQIFSTAGEDGRVLMFDLRVSSEVMCVAKYRAPFHAVMFHPIDDNFVITANAKEGAALWDLRSQKLPVIRYGGENAAQSCMSVRFNTLGNQVLALRRRLPPILFKTVQQDPVCQFYHPDYYNSCTMKSCTFAGEMDEFVLSGSDDFNLYVWRVADADLEMTNQWVDQTQMVLYGHRSIVNQVRYNTQRCLIASSGVEKVIKLWSPFELENCTGSLTEEAQGPENPREVFTHEQYISLNMTHDYSNQNTNEDPRMMAFFDYLVQQEIEGWNSETSESSDHSSENSSRPDSQTSDTEPTTFAQNTSIASTSRMTRDSGVKRGDTAALQRNKYRNRIAFLIATKRKSLKRLALKRVPRHTASRRMKSKFMPTRQNKRNPLRTTRKPYDKKIRRLSVSKYKKPVSHEQTSDSEVPQKSKKRRIQQHLNISSYRSFRRKVKTPLSSTSNTSTRAADKSDSSSDDADDTDNLRNLPSTSTSHPNNHLNHNNHVNNHHHPPLDINMPSTSTGITANGKSFLFRNAPANPNDSDDDQSIPDNTSATNENLLRVIRSPSLNNNSISNYVTGGSDDDDDDDDETTVNHQASHRGSVQKQNGHKKPNRNDDDESSSSLTRADADDYACSSNSNSRLSSSYLEDCSSSQESFLEYYSNKKRKLMHQSSSNDENANNSNNNNINNNSSSFNNNNNNNFLNSNIVGNGNVNHAVESVPGSSSRIVSGNGMSAEASSSTPASKIKQNNCNQTPDSGISSIASSSSSTSTLNGFCSSNGQPIRKNSNHYDKMKRIDKIKRNFNEDDSD